MGTDGTNQFYGLNPFTINPSFYEKWTPESFIKTNEPLKPPVISWNSVRDIWKFCNQTKLNIFGVGCIFGVAHTVTNTKSPGFRNFWVSKFSRSSRFGMRIGAYQRSPTEPDNGITSDLIDLGLVSNAKSDIFGNLIRGRHSWSRWKVSILIPIENQNNKWSGNPGSLPLYGPLCATLAILSSRTFFSEISMKKGVSRWPLRRFPAQNITHSKQLIKLIPKDFPFPYFSAPMSQFLSWETQE